jgi:hypothetical protein
MNPANLQLEGLIMACAALNRLLVEKGVLTPHEIEASLKRAEARIISDDRFQSEDIRLANRDAMCFPIRVLLLANGDEDCAAAGFGELARQVGLTKQPFNDQR